MRRLFYGMVAVGCILPVTAAWGQESLGGVAAGSSMAATLGGASAGGVMRRPGFPGAGGAGTGQMGGTGQMSGAGPAGSGSAGPGGMPPGGMGPGGPGSTAPGGAPEAMGQQGTTTPIVRRRAPRWSAGQGQAFLRELLEGSPRARPIPDRRLSPGQRATYARRVTRMTPTQRERMVMQKYKIPPVSWLSYYLPQDRYKVTSKIWQYVSIEDDTGRYPVRYYYRPWAPSMLRLLSAKPPRVRRYNRVIGFHTWQDAMRAGYRPDPESRPEPGPQLAYLARVSRGPQLAHYVEFVYGGQVSPRELTSSVSYIRRVERVVSSHSHTRPLMRETIGQILSAIMGEAPFPTYVGGTPPATVVTDTGMSSMGPMGMPPMTMPPGRMPLSP
jgi:hypothetical protein